MCSANTPTLHGNNALSNNLDNKPFLAWLQQVHRLNPGGSGRLMADAGGKALDIFLHGTEFACKNAIVKTFTQHMHSHPPMHTPKTNKEQNPQTH